MSQQDGNARAKASLRQHLQRPPLWELWRRAATSCVWSARLRRLGLAASSVRVRALSVVVGLLGPFLLLFFFFFGGGGGREGSCAYAVYVRAMRSPCRCVDTQPVMFFEHAHVHMLRRRKFCSRPCRGHFCSVSRLACFLSCTVQSPPQCARRQGVACCTMLASPPLNPIYPEEHVHQA